MHLVIDLDIPNEKHFGCFFPLHSCQILSCHLLVYPFIYSFFHRHFALCNFVSHNLHMNLLWCTLSLILLLSLSLFLSLLLLLLYLFWYWIFFFLSFLFICCIGLVWFGLGSCLAGLWMVCLLACPIDLLLYVTVCLLAWLIVCFIFYDLFVYFTSFPFGLSLFHDQSSALFDCLLSCLINRLFVVVFFYYLFVYLTFFSFGLSLFQRIAVVLPGTVVWACVWFYSLSLSLSLTV